MVAPFSSSSGSAAATACRPSLAGVSSLSASRSVRPRTLLQRGRGRGSEPHKRASGVSVWCSTVSCRYFGSQAAYVAAGIHPWIPLVPSLNKQAPLKQNKPPPPHLASAMPAWRTLSLMSSITLQQLQQPRRKGKKKGKNRASQVKAWRQEGKEGQNNDHQTLNT